MEKLNLFNSIQIMGFILMAAKAENPIAFFTLTCKILACVITLQDLFSCSCFMFESFSLFLINAFEGWWSSFQGKRKNVDFLKPCNDEGVQSETLMKGDIEVVMENVGISWDFSIGNHEFQETLGLAEISTLFDEIEPSLEEIKEAFDVFDANRDGYIDAKDLEEILRALGYVKYSELDCQRMIMAFCNGEDKRIDFRQFVKVIELSF